MLNLAPNRLLPPDDGIHVVRTRGNVFCGGRENDYWRGDSRRRHLNPKHDAEVIEERARRHSDRPSVCEASELPGGAPHIGTALNEVCQPATMRVTTDSASFVKTGQRLRIQGGAVNADALLPGGPYDVWTRGGHTERYLRDIVDAFAQWPELPKVLKPEAVRETLVKACLDGLVVLRLRRPDDSARTWWREAVAKDDQVQKEIEVLLPEAAEISSLSSSLIAADALPGVWTGPVLKVATLRTYFFGEHVAMVKGQGGVEEPRAFPRAAEAVVDAAVREAVLTGKVWIVAGSASLWKEAVPENIDVGVGLLYKPPVAIKADQLGPEALPEAWSDGETTAAKIARALSVKGGVTLPWVRVRDDIAGAITARVLAKAGGSWPCGWENADQVWIKAAVRVVPCWPPKIYHTEEDVYDEDTSNGKVKPPGIDILVSPAQLGLLSSTQPKLSQIVLEYEGEISLPSWLEVVVEGTEEAMALLKASIGESGLIVLYLRPSLRTKVRRGVGANTLGDHDSTAELTRDAT